MSDYGTRISKLGYDVKTATPSQLIYSSKWSNFKIHSIVTASLSSTTSIDSVTVGNPLPYAPFYLAFIEDTTNFPGKWQSSTCGDTSGTVFVTGGVASMPQTYFDSGTNNFTNQVSTSTTGDTYTFKVVVFIDDPVGGAGYTATAIKDYGIKISNSSFSVKTCADTDLSMSSKFSNLTIYASGIVVGNLPTDPLIISHNLGYVPIYMVMVKNQVSPTHWSYVPTTMTRSDTTGIAHIHSYVDADNLYVTPPGVSPENFTFKYIIFNERIV